MKIGVFDSGVGGLAIANALERALPDVEVIFKKDSQHFPYSTKQPDEIFGYVEPILHSLVTEGCDVIVIACNTVSTTLIDPLRERFTVPLIAVEPMVEVAAQQSVSKIIAVCATPTTLASERYHQLKRNFAANLTVHEPDCADWSALIEKNIINEQHIIKALEPAVAAGADVIVLGCTHYHWIESEIKSLVAGRAKVLQPEVTVIEEVKRVLEQLQ